MKKRFLIPGLILLAFLQGFGQEIPPAPEGRSVVYFARTSSLGFAINFTYFDSAVVIGKANGTNYVRYECEPGAHLFWARSENKDFVEAELESGKIYFIEVIPQMGAIKAAVELRPLNPSDEKRMSKVFKLMSKKPAESFTPEELEHETKGFSDVIERGLAKYREDKEKGEKINRLEKDMYRQQ